MTSVVSSPRFATRRATARRVSPAVARAVFAVALLLAAAAGFAATGRAETARAVSVQGPDFVRLMRFMGLIKAAMAAAAAAAVVWRLGLGIGAARLFAYGVAGIAMVGGLGLIWDMVHVGLGAALLHGGLIGTGLLLWRDPDTVRCLEQAVRARRGRDAKQR